MNNTLKITYVGHSLGGMTLLMYLIHKKRQENSPHYINHAILLSPAGFHGASSNAIKGISWFFSKIVSLFVDRIACPEEVINLV